MKISAAMYYFDVLRLILEYISKKIFLFSTLILIQMFSLLKP